MDGNSEQKITKIACFEKAFEKQINTIEDQGQKQVETLKSLKPEATKSESNNKCSISKEI